MTRPRTARWRWPARTRRSRRPRRARRRTAEPAPTVTTSAGWQGSALAPRSAPECGREAGWPGRIPRPPLRRWWRHSPVSVHVRPDRPDDQVDPGRVDDLAAQELTDLAALRVDEHALAVDLGRLVRAAAG